MIHNLRLICLFLLLFPVSILSAQNEPTMFQFSGTYKTVSVKVSIQTPGKDVKETEIETTEADFLEKVGIKARKTEFVSDGTFKLTYYGENDLPVDVSSGTWNFMEGKMVLIHEKPAFDKMVFSFKVSEEGKKVDYEGLVDWDKDGEKDDLIRFTDQKQEDEMMTYYMIFLYRGEKANDIPKEKLAEIQAAHLDNINKLAAEGKLVLAGPFMDNDDLRGIFILKAGSLEEAQEFTNTDPAVKAGRLRMEVKPWYGPSKLQYLFD